MSDFERYGDYNEIDESPSKSPVGRIIKIVAITLCFVIVGFLLFRVFTFNYYPKSMKQLYFNSTLTEYYNEKNGDIEALTQTWRNYGYDDPDEGNFFCSNLIVIPKIGQLQLSLRYNTSLMAKLEERHGLENLSADDISIYKFRLVAMSADDVVSEDNNGDLGEVVECTLSNVERDSFLMYRYCKLVFDGIEFGSEEQENQIEWIRLEIMIDGDDTAEPYKVLIYQNNDNYSKFEEYKLKGGEKPL